MTKWIVLFSTIALLFSCTPQAEVKQQVEVKKEALPQSMLTWKQERLAKLKAPNGWLSLAGLYRLKEGDNPFGSDEFNGVVFPKNAPLFMGSILLLNDSLEAKLNPALKIQHNGKAVTDFSLQSDATGSPSALSYKSLSWTVIKRGAQYYVRLRDTLHTKRMTFKGLTYFPEDPKWNIDANFVPFEEAKTLKLKNVLGMQVEQVSEGQLSFQIAGKNLVLDVLDGGEDAYFVILEDLTNGVSTYGGGRYIYVPKANRDGKTKIDLNKLYNPPCAFTDFATCLLAPAQNKLNIAIEAGEKYEGEH